MRVLQVTHAYPPTFGGVESHVWDLAHGLAGRGHEVQVLTGGPARPGDAAGAVPVRRRTGLGVQDLLAARGAAGPQDQRPELVDRLRALVEPAVEDFRPDLLHLHNGHHFGPELARVCLEAGCRP